MNTKQKTELMKIALAMRKARRYEMQQAALKKNAEQAKKEPDALAIAAREFTEAKKRKQQ